MNTASVSVVRDHRLPTAWVAGLIAVITVGIYWRALDAGFVGDDFMILHRLRALGGVADVFRFFRGEFFEYYRPLGFVSHAIDWAIAGQNARQFHLTNILIHTINAVLVLLIGRALSPRSLAGPVAALLFALHASNTEAVIWMSARFDLLATCFGLAAVCWMVRGRTGTAGIAGLLLFPALLSKEAAVALPLAAAGWNSFRLRAPLVTTMARVAPWVVMLVVYSTLRQVGGGVSAVGGASRIPKLVVFGVCMGVTLALCNGRWETLRDWLRTRRVQCAVALMLLLAATVVTAAVSEGRVGSLAREKLSVAGFALFYLTSPVLSPGEAVFSDPTTSIAWIFGGFALLIACGVFLSLWNTLLDDRRMWFLAAFLVATLLPVSALTEGKRYLYLPSAAVSLIAGVLIAELHPRYRRAALSVVAAILVVSAIQIAVKISDWRWAGAMTAEGARLVDSTLAPACGTGHVVFLTSPVAMRSVYSHFYYETFEVPRGCMPEVFQVVARVVRQDSRAAARWQGPGEIVITVPSYRENILLSSDLRGFTTRLRTGEPMNLQTPLGGLHAEATSGLAELRLRLTPEAQRERIHFFYYSDGQIHVLQRPQ
jgi:hypothetical protein